MLAPNPLICHIDNITSPVQLLVEQRFPLLPKLTKKEKRREEVYGRRWKQNKMAPHDLRRPFKRAAISDQQRRRELSLQRQAQHRRDAQHQARCLASFLNPHSDPEPEPEPETTSETEPEPSDSPKELDIRHASKLKGAKARKWFARQLMLLEWMIDVPDQLHQDWSLSLSLSLSLSVFDLHINVHI